MATFEPRMLEGKARARTPGGELDMIASHGAQPSPEPAQLHETASEQTYERASAAGPMRWLAAGSLHGDGALGLRGWLAGVGFACLLLAGCAGTTFAAAGLWQMGVVGHGLLELTRSSAPAPTSPPSQIVALEPAAGVPQPGVSRDRTEPASRLQTPLDTLPPPLAARPSQPSQAEASEKAVQLGAGAERTYVRTECNDVFVYIVSIAEGSPLASTASLAVGKTSPARLRRPGQRIGDWDVLAITDDWTGANPAVWLLKGNAVCRAELAGNPTRVHAPPSRGREPASQVREPPSQARESASEVGEPASQVKKPRRKARKPHGRHRRRRARR